MKPVGIVLTAVLFSLYHLNFSLIGLFSKFIIGLGFGITRQYSKSLPAPAVAHFLFWAVWGMI